MNWHRWLNRWEFWTLERTRGSYGWFISGEHLARLPAVDENDHIMEVVDEASRDYLPDVSMYHLDPASVFRHSAEQAVVPAGNIQTDIAAFLLQLPLPDMDVDNVTVRLIQDEVARDRGVFARRSRMAMKKCGSATMRAKN